MKKIEEFKGFSKETFNFLHDLSQNNNKAWFDENRERYEKHLVDPARAYVKGLSGFFNQLNPAIRTEPKFNKTIMRISKDMRFAKGAPYKEYFLIHFGKFKLDSEFFLYLEKDEYQIGLFLNNSKEDKYVFNENIVHYKSDIFKVLENYEIFNNFSLYSIDKEPELIREVFTKNDFENLLNMKYILLQKVDKPTNKLFYSKEFLVESIKIFSKLYPIYLFGSSKNPLKELEYFEENMGIPK